MRIKLGLKVNFIYSVLIAITASIYATSYAEETFKPSVDTAPVSSAIGSNNSNSDSAPEISTDTLSDIASVKLESIDYPTLQRSNNASFISKDSSQTNSKTPTKANKNPFEEINQGRESRPVNYARAAEQFCLAARDKNDADAQYALGWMYENGKGVTKDDNIAVKFYSLAAKQFHQSARESLSASRGNPNIAKFPACMSKNFIPKETNLTENSTEKDVKSAPFYVKGPIYKLVSKIAPRYQIDTDLAMAFIAVESGFNPNATSTKNAQGLMQLIPETAARFKVKNAYDPEQNIHGGLAYLQWLLSYFKGDVALVAAAYNAGENTVEKFKGIPPYPETKKYVKKIATLYKKTHHPYQDKADISKKI